MKKKLLWTAAFLILLPVSIRFISYPWSARLAADFYYNSPTRFQAMDNGINYWAEKEMGRANFNTGSSRFDGEWLFGTYMMAVMGKCQYALQYPDKAKALKAEIEKTLKALISDEVKEFDVEAWGDDPHAFNNNDHGAYLGYSNLALSFYRFLLNRLNLEGDEELLELNSVITEFLSRQISRTNNYMIQSYPDEYYSVDNCAVIASIALYDKANGQPQSPLLKKWIKNFNEVCIDEPSGTLIQSFDSQGEIFDPARASGTFLGIYFLSFVDRDISQKLFEDAKKEYFTTVLGYGAVREHRRGTEVTNGDIDSGPVVFGLGLSPIGFMMGCSRIFEDEESFTKLFATCILGGAPVDNEQWNWKTAGPVGDCILFSMLTGLKNERWAAYER